MRRLESPTGTPRGQGAWTSCACRSRRQVDLRRCHQGQVRFTGQSASCDRRGQAHRLAHRRTARCCGVSRRRYRGKTTDHDHGRSTALMGDIPELPEQFWRLTFTGMWSARPESAEQIALRLQAFTRRLPDIEPSWAEIWPLFAARQSEFSKPHLLQYTTDDLAALIDRRARFDPPRWPEPVNETGYDLILTVNRTGLDPLNISLAVHAGDRRPQGANQLQISLHRASPVHGDLDRGCKLVCAMVQAFEPEWVYANPPGPGESGPFVVRPWLTWTAVDRALPAYVQPIVAPADVRNLCGGQLQIWSGLFAGPRARAH